MARNNPRNAQDDPGSLTHMHPSDPRRILHPGDEAAPGTPGTGEDSCPQCSGSGRNNGSPCPNCDGTGKIVKAIGGA